MKTFWGRPFPFSDNLPNYPSGRKYLTKVGHPHRRGTRLNSLRAAVPFRRQILRICVVCSQNGTPALKGLTPSWGLHRRKMWRLQQQQPFVVAITWSGGVKKLRCPACNGWCKEWYGTAATWLYYPVLLSACPPRRRLIGGTILSQLFWSLS